MQSKQHTLLLDTKLGNKFIKSDIGPLIIAFYLVTGVFK